VTWTVGPKRVIEAVESAGSFLDGGASRPLQRAALPLLEPAAVLAETEAIRRTFRAKRDLMLERAREIGFVLDREPEGTFYCFVSLRELPESLADGMAFFRAALARKVITVPGAFFDVNPGRRRASHHSRFQRYARLSFGPPIEEVRCGLDRLAQIVAEAR
jgi:hypothetical protein